MKRSTSHILTTHTGSLPRSRELQELLRLREERRPLDQAAFAESVRTAVADVVQQQITIGLDVINDGEQERSQYAAYVKERLTGFEGERVIRARPRLGDTDFPDYVATHPEFHLDSTTGLYRADRVERPGGRAAGYCHLEGRGRDTPGRGGLHDRGLPRGHRELPPQRLLPH